MSSDSEDDFYDNMTERLQKEKAKFQEDRTETANLLDDSKELDEIVKNHELAGKPTRKSTRKASKETAGSSTTVLPSVSGENVAKTTAKRVRGRAKRNSSTEVPAGLLTTSKRRRRRYCSSDSEDSDENSEAEASTSRGRRGRGARAATPGRSRGRGRPRGRGSKTPRGRRNRRSWINPFEDQDVISQFLAFMTGGPQRSSSDSYNSHSPDPNIPTYSVGNTEDYPDQSHNQQLFSSNTNNQKKTEEVVVVENVDDEDNEELSVKVYWQSAEFFKFSIRKYQKLTQIFDYFAKKENVNKDKLLFTYNEKILKADDTPDSINYSIVKFVDGGIVTQGVTDLLKQNNKIKGGIKLKFQCQNMKKPYEISVRPDDKLSHAMMQCSEYLEKPLDKLKFEFDGDCISGKSTAREMEFEGGECIDVKILS